MNLTLYQVDAFTSKVFGGNPAAVIPLQSWLDDHLMQMIARENNLSETAFFIETEEGFHIRWFTPTTEVRLCGHATLATAHVLFQHLDYNKKQISFSSLGGPLSVAKINDQYQLNFPTDNIESYQCPQNIEDALGVPLVECFKGLDDILYITDSQKSVESAKVDFVKLSQENARGVILSARGDEVDFVSRAFFPTFGIDEDPVTGSAHTTLTPYWSDKLGKNTMTAKQLSERQGDIICTNSGHRTLISGNAVTYLVGQIEI